MARRTPREKKRLLIKILVFLFIFIAAALFFVMRGQENTKEITWQTGSFLRIGDTQVDYREGLIYLDAVREDYEQYYGEEIWKYAVDSNGNTVGSILKEQVLEQIIYIKVVCKKADDLGIILNEEDWKTVELQTEAYMEKLQESPLLEKGINVDIVRRIYADNLLAGKVFEASTIKVDTNVSDEEARQRRVQSIAIRNYKMDAFGKRVEYTAEEVAELQARMQELRQQAQEVDDFYKLAASITENPSMLEVVGGEGDFSEEYEEILLALSTGEVSEVIETTDYLYVFYCVTDFDVDATLAKKEEIILARQEEEFLRLYEQWRATSDVQVNETQWSEMHIISDN